jgi:hypothetical protein
VSAGNDSDFEGRRRSRVVMMNHRPVLSLTLRVRGNGHVPKNKLKPRKEFGRIYRKLSEVM